MVKYIDDYMTNSLIIMISGYLGFRTKPTNRRFSIQANEDEGDDLRISWRKEGHEGISSPVSMGVGGF